MQQKKTKRKATGRAAAPKGTGRRKKALGEAPSPLKPTSPKDKVVLAALALGAAGVVGYLGYDLFFSHRKTVAPGDSGTQSASPDSSAIPGANATFVSDTTSGSGNRKNSKNESDKESGTFPLKRGSRGAAVRRVQQALMAKYGPDILPKYGADGDFGPEMAGALKKLGLSSTISRSTYEVLIQGTSGSTAAATANDTAEQLHNAAQSGDLPTVLQLLRTLNGKEDYRSVSDAFKQLRTGGVRQTLVNGMLDSFSDEAQKQQIRYEFLRMGLLYNGSQWSLSGPQGMRLLTLQPTRVWASTDRSVPVPKGRLLGRSLATRDGFTLFENQEKLYLVKSEDVREF